MQAWFFERLPKCKNPWNLFVNSYCYWLGSPQISTAFAYPDPIIKRNKEEVKQPVKSYQEKTKEINELILKDKSKKHRTNIKERRRKNADINCKKELQEILKQIFEGTFKLVETRSKRVDSRRSNVQERCSKYIGVSKNGNNWQVLITMNKQKTYWRTFETQIQAALVYDFYSIAFNRGKAKANFSYGIQFIKDMIQSYFENDNKFDPGLFEGRIKAQLKAGNNK